MAETVDPHIQWYQVEGVAIVDVLSREIAGPAAAMELGEQLNSVLGAGETRLLLNFGRTRNMTSTAFATLLNFWKKVEELHGELRICSMDPAVRFGADILGLGRFIPIHDDQASALSAFSRAGES